MAPEGRYDPVKGWADFDEQVRCSAATGELTARCAVCGAERHDRARLLTGGCAAAKKRLRLHFNCCHVCGHWVCGACFICFDGKDSVAICRACAAREGVTGLTAREAEAFTRGAPPGSAEQRKNGKRLNKEENT